MRIEKVYFEAEDGVELVGLLHTSEEHNEDKVILSVHGMGSNCLKSRDDVIAKLATQKRISYFVFNNRGQGLINEVRANGEKILQGTVFEDVTDSYNDIVGAIRALRQRGYKKIYLQGHSLGSTKVVYSYNKLLLNNQRDILDCIKSVSLLSLVDLVDVMKIMVRSNPQVDIAKIALEKEANGYMYDIIKTNVPFIPFVSVKTFLRYYRDNEDINFAEYQNEAFEFKVLNRINENIPIFMRWGNNKELISLPADKIVSICKSKICKGVTDIDFIDGATHNYIGKEQILAEQIISFVETCE